MQHHDLGELREAFEFEPFRLELWTAQGDTVADYFDGEGQHVAHFRIRLMDDGGVGWTAAWGSRLGQGFYTRFMCWCLKQPSAYQWPPTARDRQFYLSTGWVDLDDPSFPRHQGNDPIVLDKKATRAWLKSR